MNTTKWQYEYFLNFCIIYGCSTRLMMDRILTYDEQTWSNRDFVLEKYVKNTIDGACESRGSFKENDRKKKWRVFGVRKRQLEIEKSLIGI